MRLCRHLKVTGPQMSEPETCWVLGAGGHAKVVIDALRSQGVHIAGLFDDDAQLGSKYVNKVPVRGPIPLTDDRPAQPVHIAIGDNAVRSRLAAERNWLWRIAIHSTAWISDSATILDGAMVGAGTVVQADSLIGVHTIVNTSAIVEHDAQIGAFAHIAPGAILGGGAIVGVGTLLGLGARILPNVTVGSWCRIGAGAVVIHDIPDGTTVVGVPARKIDSALRQPQR